MRIIHEKGAVGVMTFESGMIGIVGGIGAVGEDMVRYADQSYIVGFADGLRLSRENGNCGILCNINTLRRFLLLRRAALPPGFPKLIPIFPKQKLFSSQVSFWTRSGGKALAIIFLHTAYSA